MLLSITTRRKPATDLGYLLHKHPDKLHTIELSVGKAHIYYPVSNADVTTICLLLDIDPIDMVRGPKSSGGENFSLANYVNDRPYVASSFMSSAIAKGFTSALNGKCKDKPELVDQKFPLEVSISALPAPRGGEILIKKLFEPLGYEVTLVRHPLDSKFPDWGDSKYFTLGLKHTITIKELLSHLYVLIPTLDNEKHYFVSQSEIEKLLEKGEGWLKNHPEKDTIIRRYLINLNSLSNQAIRRISEGDIIDEGELLPVTDVQIKTKSLHDQRLQRVAEKIISTGAERVLDLGCGEGKLMRLLLKEKQFSEIKGMDVSYDQLSKIKNLLHYDEMSPKQKERVQIIQGSLTYRDDRLSGYDAAAVVEVIEHLDLNRLSAFERTLFEFAKPKNIFLTTPNKEYNIVFEKMDPDEFRHDDHRFEWTRKEFSDWANKVAEKYQYTVEIESIGEELENIGAPSQMAIFVYGN